MSHSHIVEAKLYAVSFFTEVPRPDLMLGGLLCYPFPRHYGISGTREGGGKVLPVIRGRAGDMSTQCPYYNDSENVILFCHLSNGR